MWPWIDAKHFLEHMVGFSPDALHVLAGVLVQLSAALLLRRNIGSYLPWMVVLGLAGLNEFADIYSDPWPDVARQYGEGAKDLILTMTLPTLLLFAARQFPQLWIRRAA